MKARTIGCPKHRSVVSPDAHREAIVTDGVRRKYLTRDAAVGFAHPLVCRVDLPTKIDHTFDLQFGPKDESRGGDDHARAAWFGFGNIEQDAWMVVIEVIALAFVRDRQEQYMPRLDGVRQEGHELLSLY
jgi:hypothetical protein